MVYTSEFTVLTTPIPIIDLSVTTCPMPIARLKERQKWIFETQPVLYKANRSLVQTGRNLKRDDMLRILSATERKTFMVLTYPHFFALVRPFGVSTF